MFDTLSATCLLVNDYDVSLRFYRDVLGLKVKDTDQGFANFQLQGTELAIFQKDAATAMFPAKHMQPAGGVILAFQVTDVMQVCKTLQGRGVEIFEGPKQTPWGQTVAYFHDPNGYVWEISQK